MALEASIPLIASTESEVPLAIWPETPPLSGGISIFEGRLKDLGLEKQDSRLERIDFQAVVAALPRPNQAFWTLSALWSGWLWGRDALGPFKSVLRRRRYDWAWHTTALQAAASSLLPLLSERTAFFGLIGELEPGFLSSALLGGALGGFELQGLALRSAGDQAQITWTSHQNRTQPKTANLDSRQLFEVAAGSGIDYLKNCGEPASYLNLQAAALEKILAVGLPSALVSAPPADVYAQTQDILENAFGFRHGFIRFGGNEKSPEAGKWWLREVENVDIPLKDRLEMALVRWLYRHSGCTLGEIDQAMCLAFPGLITPDLEWTEITLRSYGEQPNGPGGGWQLRPGDHPKARRADIEQVRSTLEAIGDRMGYKASGERSLVWQDTYGNARYAFHIFASATFAETLLNNEYPPGHSFLVLPGSRAELALYKLNHDARLRGAFERGWRFLKYRHVRRLSRAESFDPDQFEAQIGLDPLTEQPEQIRLL